jgi:hypothetical protein
MKPLQVNVEKDNLQTIVDIVYLYLQELYKVKNPSEAIQEEISSANTIYRIINEQYLFDDYFGVATVALDENLWALILNLGGRYIIDKRRVLAIEKSTEKIIGSTEKEAKKLDRLESLLEADAFNDVAPRQALLKDFMSSIPTNTELAEKTAVQVQVGDVYGQMIVASNTNGNISQTSADPEFIKLLQEMSREINGDPTLSSEQKVDALGDVQAIQAQLTKTKPNHNVLSAAATSLAFLADAAQVATAAVTFGPLIDRLAHFISTLTPIH